jgi:hypothetical protein
MYLPNVGTAMLLTFDNNGDLWALAWSDTYQFPAQI